MFTILGHLSGALGLFFMGARLMTEHMKTLSNRRFRLSALRWTSNRYLGFAWGVVAGSVMQSTTVLTLVVVGMLKSDLISPKRAFPILLGANVGCALLVLVVTLNVKLMALYILGVAQLLTLVMARGRGAHYGAMATACFGMGMIVLGSIMLKESVAPLAMQPWFQETMVWMDGSLLLPLLGGMVLTLAAQSTAPVIVAGIGMATAGLLAVDQVLVLYCGACLGSSLILYLLTLAVTGRARQVAMYQVLFNCVLSAIFLPLICIEAYGGVPLIAAALNASGLPLAQSLGLCVICFEVATAAVRLAGLDLAVRLIQRWWPPTEVEALARPQFIHDHALDDVETAFALVDLEQRRLLEMLSRYLDTVRRGHRLSDLRDATRDLRERLAEFLDDLAACCPDRQADALNAMMTRQKLFTWLEEQVLQLCDVLHALPPKTPLDAWSLALVEGIDAVLLVLIDTLESNDAAAWPSTTQLMGDRSELLHKLRDGFLKDEASLTGDERTQVLKLAGIAEHIFLLLSQLTHEYRQAAGIDEAFLDRIGLDQAARPSLAGSGGHLATI